MDLINIPIFTINLLKMNPLMPPYCGPSLSYVVPAWSLLFVFLERLEKGKCAYEEFLHTLFVPKAFTNNYRHCIFIVKDIDGLKMHGRIYVRDMQILHQCI